MNKIDKEIMRLGVYVNYNFDNEKYTSLILKDAYMLYSPSKIKDGQIQNGIYLSGRFERIKLKENEQRFDFNLN